jgi:HEAT repeats
MPTLQLDLFAGSGSRPDQTAAPTAARPRHIASELEDEALIAAIPHASLGDCGSLAAEAGSRQLVGAVLALEALCRRFRGFGLEHPVPEQTAALEALAEIGGGEAAGAVRRIIVEKIVQGSGLKSALQAAARLGVGLPVNVVVSLLRHEAPEIRAGGCRCARSPAVIPLLLERLDDPDHVVAREAACALGRMGGTDARPMLLRLLQQAPSAAVIDAISAIADEECLVILGRIARTGPDLVDVALEALDSIGTPPALKIAAASRRSLGRSSTPSG